MKQLTNKVKFDENDENHVAEFKFFLQHSKWNNLCPFKLEAPFFTVPDMIQHKLIRKFLNV